MTRANKQFFKTMFWLVVMLLTFSYSIKAFGELLNDPHTTLYGASLIGVGMILTIMGYKTYNKWRSDLAKAVMIVFFLLGIASVLFGGFALIGFAWGMVFFLCVIIYQISKYAHLWNARELRRLDVEYPPMSKRFKKK